MVALRQGLTYVLYLLKDVTDNNFGFLIAIALPGFTAMLGIAEHSETARSWLGTTAAEAPTIGGFLYVTIASLAAGMTVSAARWLILDSFHHATGIPRPQWDFSRLQANVTAFSKLIEIHYKYYQFYGGMGVAIPFWYVSKWVASGVWKPPFGWYGLGVLAIEVLFLAGSRDTAKKYYGRVAEMLRSESPGGPSKKPHEMTGTPTESELPPGMLSVSCRRCGRTQPTLQHRFFSRRSLSSKQRKRVRRSASRLESA